MWAELPRPPLLVVERLWIGTVGEERTIDIVMSGGLS